MFYSDAIYFFDSLEINKINTKHDVCVVKMSTNCKSFNFMLYLFIKYLPNISINKVFERSVVSILLLIGWEYMVDHVIVLKVQQSTTCRWFIVGYLVGSMLLITLFPCVYFCCPYEPNVKIAYVSELSILDCLWVFLYCIFSV